MSIHDSPNFSLTADDVAAFAVLIRMQSDISPDTGGSLTQAKLLDFMQGLTQFPYQHYFKLSNARLKGWIDALYNAVITTQTAYGCRATGLYIAYTFSTYIGYCWIDHVGECDQGRGYPPNWNPAGGIPFSYYDVGPGQFPETWGYFFFEWNSPGQSASLVHDIDTLMHQWAQNPPANVISFPPDRPISQWFQWLRDLQNLGWSLFDPLHWTDAHKLADNLSPLWTEQSNTLTTLLKQPTLQPDTCPFLLYLLTAQGTSTVKDQQRANTIITALVDSTEYPNDTLINQLIYHNLMYWADPMGSFAWNNAQLQSTLKTLSDAISSNDPASQAIVTALTRHLKILTVDSAYPMQDPYNPNIGFNQRKTDTLAAINRAWPPLKP